MIGIKREACEWWPFKNGVFLFFYYKSKWPSGVYIKFGKYGMEFRYRPHSTISNFYFCYGKVWGE